jgi:hypothetical protein
MRRVTVTCVFLLLAASAQAADDIRTLVQGGVVEGLRWPDVSDYRKQLDAFYLARKDALAWSRDGRPTPHELPRRSRVSVALPS